jgi:triphosphoribosyl-dephospho-CoA synthase
VHHILIVEDSPTMRSLVVSALEDLGLPVRITEAVSGFEALRECGLAAEERMMVATGGVNTHRGAIFSIGLLAAAAGSLAELGTRITANRVCATVASRYGPSIIQYADVTRTACGSHLKPHRELFGARAEACAGFPTGLQIGLPAYRFTLRKTSSGELAAIQSLFAIMSQLDDTNLLRRGGDAGLKFAKTSAADFLLRGGVFSKDWPGFAQQLHGQFVSRNLSPGGSADLLGVTLFLDGLERLSDATCTFI